MHPYNRFKMPTNEILMKINQQTIIIIMKLCWKLLAAHNENNYRVNTY